MKINILILALISLNYNSCLGQKAQQIHGPVFEDIGVTFDIENADFIPDSSSTLKAIFDIDYMPKDSLSSNFIISSLHRYLNMHVNSGVKESNIYLALVLHGASTKDALTNESYKRKYGVDNPNINLIKTLSDHGVDLFLCGQSAAYSDISKSEILPEIKLALSAMSVLTVYQAKGYSLIKF